jgi:hypothetical protein
MPERRDMLKDILRKDIKMKIEFTLFVMGFREVLC